MDHDSCQSFLLNSTDYSSISLNKNLSDYANSNSPVFDTILFNLRNLSIVLKDIKKAVANGENIKVPYNYPGSTEIWKNLELSDYCKLFAYVIVFFGGFLGNISVILTVAFNKSLWKTIHFYVANLAMADAMICLFCMIPHALSVVTNKVYVLGKVMCKFNSFAEMTCLISSVITLAAISWNRRFGVLSPLKKKVADPNISLLVTFIWIISIAVSIPLLIVKKLLVIEWLNFTDTKCVQKWPIYWYIDKSTIKCFPQQTLRFTYYVVVLTTMYFLPVIIMLFAYSSIVWRVRKESFAEEGNEDNRNTKPINWKKVTKNVVFSFFAFVICWTPVQVIVMYSAFIPDDSDSEPDEIPKWIVNITWASQFLAYSNSLINPIIFGGFNKAYIEGFCNVLRCRCRKRRPPMPGLSERKSTSTSSVSRNLSRLQSGDCTANQNPNINMNLLHISGNGKIHP